MLFKIEKFKEPEKPKRNTGDFTIEDDTTEHIPIDSLELIEVINKVEPGKTIHWVTVGYWSMHHMLQALLNKTGAAHVYISSYAFSEYPARFFASAKEEGLIKSLNCVIDSRIDVRSASAYTLIQNCSDRHKLCNTHAKVTVIENDNWLLAVVGSANYTTNKRYESGFICCSKNVAEFHKKWIINELNQD